MPGKQSSFRPQAQRLWARRWAQRLWARQQHLRHGTLLSLLYRAPLLFRDRHATGKWKFEKRDTSGKGLWLKSQAQPTQNEKRKSESKLQDPDTWTRIGRSKKWLLTNCKTASCYLGKVYIKSKSSEIVLRKTHSGFRKKTDLAHLAKPRYIFQCYQPLLVFRKKNLLLVQQLYRAILSYQLCSLKKPTVSPAAIQSNLILLAQPAIPLLYKKIVFFVS
jgi:hypothetical protein